MASNTVDTSWHRRRDLLHATTTCKRDKIPKSPCDDDTLSTINTLALGNDLSLIQALAHNATLINLIGRIDPALVRFVSPEWIPATNPVNDGIHYNMIEEAMASITDASATQEYLILVWPGTYGGAGNQSASNAAQATTTLVLKPYVRVRGLPGTVMTQNVVFEPHAANDPSALSGFTMRRLDASQPLIISYTAGHDAVGSKLRFTECNFFNVWIQLAGSPNIADMSEFVCQDCNADGIRFNVSGYFDSTFQNTIFHGFTAFGAPGDYISVDHSFVTLFGGEWGIADVGTIRVGIKGVVGMAAAHFYFRTATLVLQSEPLPVGDPLRYTFLAVVSDLHFAEVYVRDYATYEMENVHLYIKDVFDATNGAQILLRQSSLRKQTVSGFGPGVGAQIRFTSTATAGVLWRADNATVDCKSILINDNVVGDTVVQPAEIMLRNVSMRVDNVFVVGTNVSQGARIAPSTLTMDNFTLSVPSVAMFGAPQAPTHVSMTAGKLELVETLRNDGAVWTANNTPMTNLQKTNLIMDANAITIWSNSSAIYRSIQLRNASQWYVSDGSVRWLESCQIGQSVRGYFTNSDTSFELNAVGASNAMTYEAGTTDARFDRTFQVVRNAFMGIGNPGVNLVVHVYDALPPSGLHIVPYITPPIIVTSVIDPPVTLGVPTVVVAPAATITPTQFETTDNHVGPLQVVFTLTQSQLPLQPVS